MEVSEGERQSVKEEREKDCEKKGEKMDDGRENKTNDGQKRLRREETRGDGGRYKGDRE